MHIPPQDTKQDTVKSSRQLLPTSVINDPRVQRAKKLDKQGEFAAALIQWKILNTKYPKNTEFKQRVAAHKSLIKHKTKLQLRIAKKAFKEKKYEEAKIEFLKILALDPLHPEPIPYLRQIQELNLKEQQTVKLAKMTQNRGTKKKSNNVLEEYQDDEDDSEDQKTRQDDEQNQERYYFELGIELFNNKDYIGSIREIEKYLNTYPDDESALKQISNAYMAIGTEYFNQGLLKVALTNFDQSLAFNPLANPELIKKIEKTRFTLAEQTYQKGMRVYRDDLNEAINFFKLSLKFFPKHVKSKIALNKALKMRDKLNSLN